MSDRLPPLTSLLALDAFQRTGSVTRAAERLGRTHGAVSKQLHQLQDDAGVDLFVKRGQHLELTTGGRTFANSVSRNIDDIRQAYGQLRGGTDQPMVTIAASSTFARHWLIPTIARFNIDVPDIEILIRLVGPQGSRKLDGPVDLVLSWDRLLSPAADHPGTVSLGDVHIGLVLSPSYEHRISAGTLTLATVIRRHGTEAALPRWSEQSGYKLIYEREITFDLSALAFEAAERKMGAVIAPKFLIEQELKRGTLIAPLGFLVFKDGLHAHPSKERPKLGKYARIFFDWLADNARLADDGFIAAPADMSAPSSDTLAW